MRRSTSFLVKFAILLPFLGGSAAFGEFRNQGAFEGSGGSFCYEFSDTGSMASCAYSGAKDKADRSGESAAEKGKSAEDRAGQASRAAEKIGKDRDRFSSEISGMNASNATALRSRPYEFSAPVSDALKEYVSSKLHSVGDLLDQGKKVQKNLEGYAARNQEVAARQFQEAEKAQSAARQFSSLQTIVQGRIKGMSSILPGSKVQGKSQASQGKVSGAASPVAEIAGKPPAGKENSSKAENLASSSSVASSIFEHGSSEENMDPSAGRSHSSTLPDPVSLLSGAKTLSNSFPDKTGSGVLLTADEEIGALSFLLSGEKAPAPKSTGSVKNIRSLAEASLPNEEEGKSIFERVSVQYRKRENFLQK